MVKEDTMKLMTKRVKNMLLVFHLPTNYFKSVEIHLE